MNETPKRLAPTPEVIRLLLAHSGNRCAFPGCPHPIFDDTGKLVAQCCHIESALPDGERFNPYMSNEERRSYENLLFLCYAHHVTTNDTVRYSVEKLKEIKVAHEAKFKENAFKVDTAFISTVLLGFNELKQVTDETAEIVRNIEKQNEKILEALRDSSKNTNKDELTVFETEFRIPYCQMFIGRQNELEEAKQAIQQYNTLLLGGVSGIGKSCLVAELIKNDDAVIWMDCMSASKEYFFTTAANFIAAKFSDFRLKQLQQSGLNNETQQIQLLIACMETYKVTIVFDGLNDKSHTLIPTLTSLNQFCRKAKILITSVERLNESFFYNPVYAIEVRGLQLEGSYNLLKSLGVDTNEAVEELRSFVQSVDGHPYLLKLFSTLSKRIHPKQLLVEFKDVTDDKIFKYIKERVFGLLTPNEKQLLISLSIFRACFRMEAINYFSHDGNGKEIFIALNEKYLVAKKFGTTEFYEIHEFIKTFTSSLIDSTTFRDLNTRAFDYLNSIKEGLTISEANEQIYHGISAKLFTETEQKAHKFLTSLLLTGQFDMANQIANNLENIEQTSIWDFIYYVQGRVLRFRQEWENSLQKYEAGISKSRSENFTSVLLFEKASVLIYLYRFKNINEYKTEAIALYTKLAETGDAFTAVKANSSLAYLKTEDGQSKDAIEILQKNLEYAKSLEDRQDLLPSILQGLGVACIKLGNYNKAIEYYKECISEYERIIPILGMNAFDGIYYAYTGMAWALAKAGLVSDAAKTSYMAADMALTFNMLHKAEAPLFDCGYNLLVNGEFERAKDVLTKHYDLIIANEDIEELDMPLIHGTLMMAHWYCGDFLNAVELMGLYILSCAKQNIRPAIAVAEADNSGEDGTVLKMFKKRIYLLILLENTTFNNFSEWINEVVKKRPELHGPLNSFLVFEKAKH